MPTAEEERGINAGNRTFRDRFGNKWDLTITAYTVQRIENSDFTALWDGEVTLIRPDKELLTELMNNRPLCLAVVWAICSADAEELDPKYDEIKFLKSIDGRAAADAINAFWESLEDFFPEAKTVISTLNSLRKQAEQQARTGLAKIEKEAMEKLGPQAKTKIQQAIDKQLSELERTLRRELAELEDGESSSPRVDVSG